MPFMNAKYPGTCVTCNGKIKVGDEIYWSKETGAAHRRSCPEQPKVEAQPVVKAASHEKLVPGVYEFDGQVYAVRMRKDKTGLYAMKMIEVGEGVVRATESGERVRAIEFKYEYGVVLGFESKMLKLSDRMSVERGKELVTLYGRCLACNRKLSAASSVEKGIGPVCIGYFGPVLQEVPVETIDGRNIVTAAA